MTNTVVDSAANCVFIEDFLYSQIEAVLTFMLLYREKVENIQSTQITLVLQKQRDNPQWTQM